MLFINQRKAKKGFEAEALTWMPEVIPRGVEEQEEEEEEEEETVLTFHSQGLRSRGPAILVEGEPAGESTMAEGVERPEKAVEGFEVVIQEFQLGLELLRPMREGRRCNNLGLPAC